MNDRHAALARLVQELFTPASSTAAPHVGVEVELFPIRFVREEAKAVTIAELQGILATAGQSQAGGWVSFEPGGQLEFSSPPAATMSALVRQVADLLDDEQCAAAPHGVAFKAEGVNRWLTSDQVGLQKDTERYRKMQRHFDAIGPAGRQMMRRTASLQVCLDLLPGRAGHEQWRLLNWCGPALAAVFTNQPHLDRLADPTVESRSRIWQAVDASRTGFDGAQIGDLDGRDWVSAYRDFSLRAEVIPLDEGKGEASPLRASLGEWIASDRHRPTVADLTHHLTTLFPPVRPRGRYLEVRYLDALPLPWLAVPLCLLTTLSYVPNARQAALEALTMDTRPLQEQWRSSARSGLREPHVRGAAEALFTLARVHLGGLPEGYLPPDAAALIEEYRDRFLTRGAAPADEDSSVSTWRMPREDKLCVLA
jgi:glutamate--cysteine ligase